MQELAGKVALVTGGTRGIGAATVLELAKRGARVAFTYVSDSSTDRAHELIARIEALGNGSAAVAIQADIASVEAPAKIVEETIAVFGEHIDILVNNAGIFHSATITSATVEDFEKVFNTNVRGVIFLTQAVIPHLPKSGGKIIIVGSTAARLAFLNGALYPGSKAALEAFTRYLALELGPQGHTVNNVAAGTVQTDIFARVMGNPVMESFLEKARAETPLENRHGTPEDIAMVISALVDPRTKWITGQCISASGGYMMV